jgi:ketosteroid isomerase-like protein
VGARESVSGGYARYAPGESNEWVVTYDEALIVTKGAITVTSADGVETDRPPGRGYLPRRGHAGRLLREGGRGRARVRDLPTLERGGVDFRVISKRFVEEFQPSDERPEPSDAVALLRSIFDPLERGEADDFGRFHDTFADDVVLENSFGEVRGKEAVIAYLTGEAATLVYDIFVGPLEYFGDGNRAVQVGGEIFTVKATGETCEADWAWVFDVEDGRITRILAIQDLSGVADVVTEAMEKTRAA